MPTKNPKIFSVEKNPYDYSDDGTEFYVEISLRALRSLPDWVSEHISWQYAPANNRCRVEIEAKDELEAMMRFRKLWEALLSCC